MYKHDTVTEPYRRLKYGDDGFGFLCNYRVIKIALEYFLSSGY